MNSKDDGESNVGFKFLNLKRNRNAFLDAKTIPLPSDYDDDVINEPKHSDQNHYRPLPLPMKDAIRYVRKYGRHAESLRKYEDELRKLPKSRVMFDHFRNEKRSSSKCGTKPKDKGRKKGAVVKSMNLEDSSNSRVYFWLK